MAVDDQHQAAQAWRSPPPRHSAGRRPGSGSDIGAQSLSPRDGEVAHVGRHRQKIEKLCGRGGIRAGRECATGDDLRRHIEHGLHRAGSAPQRPGLLGGEIAVGLSDDLPDRVERRD